MDRDESIRGAGDDGARRTSVWAILSLLAGACILCPAASLLGPVLGVAALLDIRRNPRRSGSRLAIAGIVLGLLATAGWAAAATWWHVHARVPMLEGPARELRMGLAGDVEAFRAGFTGPDAGPDEASEFLDEARGRYGRFIRSAQRAPSSPGDPAGTGPNWASGRVRIPYSFLFEAGPLDAEAEFVVTAGGPRPLLKFAWLALRDDERGDLVYPAEAAAGRIDGP